MIPREERGRERERDLAAVRGKTTASLGDGGGRGWEKDREEDNGCCGSSFCHLSRSLTAPISTWTQSSQKLYTTAASETARKVMISKQIAEPMFRDIY